MKIGSKRELTLGDGTNVIAFRINENEHQFTLTSPAGSRGIYYYYSLPLKEKAAKRRDDITQESAHWPEIHKLMGTLGYWLV